MDFLLVDIILCLNNIVGAFVIIRFLNSLLEKRELKKTSKWCSLIIVLISATSLNILSKNLVTNLILGLSLNFFIGHLFYCGAKHIKIIAALFIVVFSFVTELLTAVSFGIVFGATIEGIRENFMYLFIGGVVSKIILLLLIEIIVMFRNRNVSKVSLSSWILIISIPIVSIILSVLVVYEPLVQNSVSSIAVFACLAIIYIDLIAFYLFDSIIIQIDENNLIKFREDQLLLQQSQYKNIISGYSQINKIRHDMLAHLIAIDGYLSESQIKEAKSYIRKLNNEIDFSKNGILSENIAVDAIINNRSTMARELGIIMNVDIMIPQKLKIDDIDMCIVLGNALNNAIEACQRIDNDSLRSIGLKMKYKRNTLLLEINNSYNVGTIRMKNKKFISSKSYKTLNETGIGISNIVDITVKYGGVIEQKLKPPIFTTKIIIPDKYSDT